MSDFPRMITLLRKEKGLSQKQAALELGVSQALLSHYEKGIRECGLDFAVKIADYYSVSCDYLLGRTADRHGMNFETGFMQNPENKSVSPSNTALSANKQRIIHSIEIIFGILEQADCKGLNLEISSYLMVSVYKTLRILYSANPKNPQAMFSVMPEVYRGLSSALQCISESNAECLSHGKNTAGSTGLDSTFAPSLSPDIISRSYPELAPSLYELVQKTENKLKKLS